jgi:hypothetical protein
MATDLIAAATLLPIADHPAGVAALLFAAPVVAMLLALGALVLRERRGAGGEDLKTRRR